MLTHKISFQHEYRSIKIFPEICLPDFTIVTGLNGTGKTHLLEAINANCLISTAATPQGPNDQGIGVRLLNWSDLMPKDTGAIKNPDIREARKQQLWDQLNKATRNSQQTYMILATIQRFQIPLYPPVDLFIILRKRKEEIESLLSPDSFREFCEIYRRALDEFETIYGPDAIFKNPWLKCLAEQKKTNVSSLDATDILESDLLMWEQNDIFQQSFGPIFVEYRQLQIKNFYNDTLRRKNQPCGPYLEEEEFILKYGAPPWDEVNDIFERGNLGYKINHPTLELNGTYEPRLIKKHTNTEISFADLSSGEKILMSLALSTYFQKDGRNIVSKPKIFLFDEIDAPLHPSMTRNLINVIQEVLIGKFGVKVIMTTHSPSTVALAPEESIYTMRSGEPGVHKTSKAKALNILTSGIPTLAISHDGRRQVFVESPNDAKIYDAIYGKIKTNLNSDRSLEFIATGMEVNNQHFGTGCEILKKTVTELARSGNASVYGLVDWDGKHQPDDRLAVLAHNRFDGMENVLLDPFLVGLLIALECTSYKSQIGLKSEEYFTDIINSSTERKQELADKVAICIFGSARSKKISKKYRGGLELNVDSETATTDDHEYEEKMTEAFQFLKNAYNKHPQKLMGKLVDVILMNHPELIPKEFEDVFLEILNKPAHSDER